jgi:cytochrome c553
MRAAFRCAPIVLLYSLSPSLSLLPAATAAGQSAPASAQVAAPVPTPVPTQVPDTLAQRLVACTACHGDPGKPPPRDERRYFPRIAGKPAGYLYHQLLNFREGRRQYPLMTWMVTPLSDDYLREIADYFAAQHLAAAPLDRAALPPAELARGRQLVTQGDPGLKVPACIACHGQRLTGTLPAIPGLLGLPRDYINAQFGAWRNGSRRAHAPDCMGTIAARLSLADVAAVSAWLASEPQPADPAPQAAGQQVLPLACGSVQQASSTQAKEQAR